MLDTVIRVENLSKQYRLGEVGTGTLSHDLKRWWYRVRGKEDPFLKIGEVNDRAKAGESDYVWALRDINFEVKRGEVLGIIGRNGAGKSTLLKILSKTTSPTTGQVKIKGRIASLLEVGTGFHPEQTGRENIFLNGAILGMTKKEIQNKFEEIVDFAGVERYIDTPVKRYSSGMYVRLAFAVAAYLEPDILIVDEVLAVGDAEFQRKCLGKMKDVSVNEGRTVLFVSHNMASIKALCDKGLMLDRGQILVHDEVKKVTDLYGNHSLIVEEDTIHIKSSCGRFILHTPYWVDQFGKKTNFYGVGEKMLLRFAIEFLSPVPKVNPGFAIVDAQEQRIFTSHFADDQKNHSQNELQGMINFDTEINLPIAPGTYKVIYGVRDEFEHTVIYKENVLLEIHQTVLKNGASGILWYTSDWHVNKV